MKLLKVCAICLLFILGMACALPSSATVQSKPVVAEPQLSPAEMDIRIFSASADSLPEHILEESEEPGETPLPMMDEGMTDEPNEALTESAVIRVNDVGIVGRTFQRGEIVTVTEEKDGFCTVEAEDGEWLVESWLLRGNDVSAPKAYTGYARSGAEVFPDPYLEGKKLATLSVNARLAVEDAFGTLLRVTLADGSEGYVRAAQISKNLISSGGSGSSSSSSGQDGGDIPLSAHPESGLAIVTLSMRPLYETEPFIQGTATILADGVEGYLSVFAAEDIVQILERDEDCCTALLGKQTGTVAADLLRFEEEPPYEAWDGYAQYKAPLYRHYRTLDEPTPLKMNTAVHVMGEMRDLYMVEVDGEAGFLPKDQVSRTIIAGGSSGSSDGSGGDWTAPVL